MHFLVRRRWEPFLSDGPGPYAAYHGIVLEFMEIEPHLEGKGRREEILAQLSGCPPYLGYFDSQI